MNALSQFNLGGSPFIKSGNTFGVPAGFNSTIISGAPAGLGGSFGNFGDRSFLSSATMDPFTNFNNPFSSFSGGLGNNLGAGSIPGFGGALDPTGSMFGGLMQQMQSQQQMMMMMMMMMVMMMTQQKNGFAGNQQGNNPAGAPGIPSGGTAPASGGGGSAPASGGGGSAPASGGGNAAPVNSGPVGPVGQGAMATVDLAKRFLGRNSDSSLVGDLPHFQNAGNRTKNCADFVSACLESTGRLKGHQINVGRMEEALKQQGWRQVSQAQARPGDVWMTSSRSHVELVAEAGGKKLIGSNNINSDGSQKISYGQPYGEGGGVYYTKD